MASSAGRPGGRSVVERALAAGSDDLVVVLHQRGAAPSTRRTGAAAALVEAAYQVVEMPIDGHVVERLTRVRPSAVIVVVEPLGLGLVRLCRDLSSSLECRIILVVNGRLDDEDVIDALDAGADDVVSGDVSGPVLDARVRVAMRAYRPTQPTLSTIEVGDVLIDGRAHSVLVGGQHVRCPPVQYVLLTVLARAINEVMRPDELLRVVWGVRSGDVDTRRVRIAISELRKILGTGPARPLIETIPRVGYRMLSPGATADVQPAGGTSR